MIMRAELREAIGVYTKHQKLLDDKLHDIEVIKDTLKVIERFIITIEGTCQECGNPHWPHCNGDEA